MTILKQKSRHYGLGSVGVIQWSSLMKKSSINWLIPDLLRTICLWSAKHRLGTHWDKNCSMTKQAPSPPPNPKKFWKPSEFSKLTYKNQYFKQFSNGTSFSKWEYDFQKFIKESQLMHCIIHANLDLLFFNWKTKLSCFSNCR